MKNWDFFGLFNQGEQEDAKARIREQLRQGRLVDTPLVAPKVPTPTIPTQDTTNVTPEEQVAPQEKPQEDTSILEDVADIGMQAVGGTIDTLDNTIELFSNYDVLSAPKLVVNLPFLPNYDKNRPSIFTMEDQEFDDLYKKGKITYLPKVPESNSMAGNFTRGMAQALSGIYMGSRTIKGVKAGITATGSSITTTGALGTEAVTGRLVNIVGPGVVGSMFSYKPFTPRLANSISEFMDNTPFEVAQPFFEWLGSSDDNSAAEERFKGALESFLIDISTVGATKGAKKAFNSKVFKMFKRERELTKAEMGNASDEELAALDDVLTADIKRTPEQLDELPLEEVQAANVEDVGLTPIGTPKVTQVEETADSLLSEYARQTGEDEYATLARESTAAAFKYSFPNQPKIFNTSKVEELGARKALNLIGTRLDEEFRKIRPDTPFGPKTLDAIEIDGIKVFDQARFLQVKGATQDLADELGLDRDVLYQVMKKDLDDVVGLEARVTAYRTMLAQMGGEFDEMIMASVNDPTDVVKAAAAYNKWQDIQEVMSVFAELRRTVARTTTAQRISIKKQGELGPEDLKGIAKQLKGKNVDQKLITLLSEASQMSANPLKKIRDIKQLERTFSQKGWDAAVELYRGMLLASGKTHLTNILSGINETLMTPTATAIGGAFRADKQALKDSAALLYGAFSNFVPATKWMLKAITDERNFLDPSGTKLDVGMKTRSHAIAMNAIDPNKPIFHPVNWMTLGVNTAGKFARGSLRFLGGEDEFFKQLNYRAKAYQQIVRNMPDNIKTRAQRKDYIASQLDKYFDPKTGQATDKKALEYAQRVTFTEDLEKGSLARALQEATNEKPYLKMALPFVKTPANIFSRYLERTPIVSPFMKKTRERWATGDPQIRAEIVGNMAIGTAMYGSAMAMVSSGHITGGGPTDPDQKKMWLAANNKPYSIKIGDDWVSYNRFDPSAMAFATVADIYENAWKYSDQEMDSLIGGVIGGFMQGVTNRTWMQSIKRFFDIYDAAAKGRLGDEGGKIAGQFVSGFIPPIINETYEFVEGPQPFLETRTFMEKIQAKAAPLTGYKAAKHNWLTGEPLIHPFMYNTGIPVTQEKVNPYIEELAKMQSFIAPPMTSFGNVKLSGPEYAEYCEKIGNISTINPATGTRMNLMSTLEEHMRSNNYDWNPNKVYRSDYPDGNVKSVLAIINVFKNAAKLQMLDENPRLRQLVIQDQENAINAQGNNLNALQELIR